MATGLMKSANTFSRHLRRAILLSDRNGLSDSRLMETFRADGDEAAFEMLVKRHGPMVLGVCRRVIGNLHDAEDAFQAVFLVLAKKAASIAHCDLIGNWLYGTAYRTALQARSRLSRRRARELQVKDMPQPAVSPECELHELHQVLDLELSKLNDKYRVPIVLCELEGRSRRDVARLLKIPEGTLSSRLATARRHLARRLARHGLTMSAGVLAAALSQQTASACVRTGLVTLSAKVAGLTAAGQPVAGILSAQALGLSQGALKTMLLNKLKVISLVCLGIVAGGFGAGLGVPRLMADPAVSPAQSDHPAQQAEPGRPPADQEPLDGALLLEQQIQKHLQLSPNQINKLQTISRDVDAKTEGKRKQIDSIQKRIEVLQKQIAELQTSINDEHAQIGQVRDNIEGERKQAVGKAAPKILSARSVHRLREIQRQQRGLHALLQDPKVQRMLKIDDEQVRKIEEIVKKEAEQSYIYLGWNRTHLRPLVTGGTGGVVLTDLDKDGRPDIFITGQNHWFTPRTDEPRLLVWDELFNQTTLWKDQIYVAVGDGSYEQFQTANVKALMDVLTDSQRKTLLDYVGKPYNSPSWHELWKQYGRKGAEPAK
jgi:RNA polymerase sigma factor (sigma-70 family)